MMPGVLASIMLSPAKILAEPPTRTKGTGGRTTTLHHHTMTTPSADMSSFSTLAISMPAVNKHHLLLNHCS